jgi:hypothetical protein
LIVHDGVSKIGVRNLSASKMERAHYEVLCVGLMFRKNDATHRRSDAAIDYCLRPRRPTDSRIQFTNFAAASRVSGNSKPIPPRGGCRVTTP